MQAVSSIKLVVLDRIDDVEPNQPEDDSRPISSGKITLSSRGHRATLPFTANQAAKRRQGQRDSQVTWVKSVNRLVSE